MWQIYKQEEILKAERMLKAYEIYLRETEAMDDKEEIRKKKLLNKENFLQYKLRSQDYIPTIVILRDLSEKLARLESKIGNIKNDISRNKIFKQNLIMQNIYKKILHKDMSNHQNKSYYTSND
jgi:hypothetical protein